jgi:hypothetical protein
MGRWMDGGLLSFKEAFIEWLALCQTSLYELVIDILGSSPTPVIRLVTLCK